MKPPRYALHLAERGIPVFPCCASKKPTLDRGFHDASSDEREVHRFWRERPGPLIGFPTGPASGLDLLDIDPRHGGLDWLDEFATFVGDTYVVQTRSGGTHLFYKHSPGMRNSEGEIAPGVDVRGAGGYAVAWAGCGGFIVRDLPSAEWPEWLGRAAFFATKGNRKLADGEPTLVEAPRPKLEGGTHTRRMLQRCLDRVSSASPGQRHYALRSAAYTIGGFLNDDLVRSEASRRLLEAIRDAGGSDVDESNAKATIESGLTEGKKFPFERAA